MAIKGVSEIRRLPRLGKIRLGEKALAKSGAEYPKAVDYFVCPPEVQAVYGEKPRMLEVIFPIDDQDIFFPQWYKRYGSGSGLLCKGDGETATMLDKETGEIQEIACVPDECEWYAKKHCRRLANLQFMLPRVPGVGVWQIDTTSFYSIINLNSSIDMIRAIVGRIRMIPLQLILKPQEVAPDGRKKTVYVLDLVAPVTLEKLLAQARTALPQFVVSRPDDNDHPEDLYPDAVLNKQAPEPLTFDAPPSPEPITPPPAAGDGNGQAKKLKKQQKEEQAAADQAAMEGSPARQEFIEKTDQLLEKELHAAWDELGTPPAKRKAMLATPGRDKEKLLQTLKAEIDRRKEARGDFVAGLKGESVPPVPPPAAAAAAAAAAQPEPARQLTFF